MVLLVERARRDDALDGLGGERHTPVLHAPERPHVRPGEDQEDRDDEVEGAAPASEQDHGEHDQPGAEGDHRTASLGEQEGGQAQHGQCGERDAERERPTEEPQGERQDEQRADVHGCAVLVERLERLTLDGRQQPVAVEGDEAVGHNAGDRDHEEADHLSRRRDQVRHEHVHEGEVQEGTGLPQRHVGVSTGDERAKQADHHEAGEREERRDEGPSPEPPPGRDVGVQQQAEARRHEHDLERAEGRGIVEEEDRLPARQVLGERVPRE